jgi:hypothetical protein
VPFDRGGLNRTPGETLRGDAPPRHARRVENAQAEAARRGCRLDGGRCAGAVLTSSSSGDCDLLEIGEELRVSVLTLRDFEKRLRAGEESLRRSRL